MGRIDTSRWGEFLVGDLFDAERGKVKNLQNQKAGDIPVIAAGGFNQGIAGMFDVSALHENKITISCNGAGCGSVFYHPYKFNLNGDAIVLTELHPMSDLVKQFISCMLNGVLTRKYSYAEKCSADKAKSEKIKLPIDINGNPNFAYMEQYMQNLESAVSSSLTALRSAKSSKTCENVNLQKWQQFKVEDIFPRIIKPEVYHTRQLIQDVHGIPYVVRSKFNNGIKYRVKKPIGKINPANVISFGAENATFFYQQEEWVSGRDMYYIDVGDLSFYSCCFLTSVFQVLAAKYSYNNGLFPDKLKKEKIMLPVNEETGKIDFVYMEEFMEKRFFECKECLDSIVAV